MTLRRILLALSLVSGSAIALVSGFIAPANACTAHVSLTRSAQLCVSHKPPGDTEDDTRSEDVITYEPLCVAEEEKVCTDTVVCTGKIGPDGIAAYVLINGVRDHETCLTPGNSDSGPNGADIVAAFRRLTWPASELTIQPPDGKTLVNFDTNFFTRDDDPVTQRITLLGQRITIEATPVEYT